MKIDHNIRHKLAKENKISSKDDVRAFCHSILLQHNVDITAINIAEEGITFECFNDVIKAIYLAGYNDGMLQIATLKGKKKELLKERELFYKHKNAAKEFNENSIYG